MKYIHQIMWIDEISSTNDLALQLAQTGDTPGMAIVADRQSRGRGRSGKRWISPRGQNVYLSVLVTPRLMRGQAEILTLMAAVACVEAVLRSCGLKVAIKWPNDLLVADRKLGGILVEARSAANRLALAVIGIGLNVNSTKFAGRLGRTATSIFKETGTRWNRTAITREILASLDKWLGVLERRGVPPVLDAWRRSNATIGRRVRIRVGACSLSGTATAIDGQGRLRVRTSTGTRTVDSGSLTLCRHHEGPVPPADG
jgi:BirA family biotin operon repressor/biotin-[acetyl-CoA-carboxylase] ligase